MAYFDGTVFSDALGMMTSLAVILPEDRKAKGGAPVLYLLHGLSDNHSAWVRRTNIDRYAQAAGLAVVMPEVQRSFYADMAYGLNYFTYIAEELPTLCRRMFHIAADREDTYIAGLSMGGYGAMKAALTHPGQYAAAASFSGVMDIRARIPEGDPEFIAINNGNPAKGDDLFYLADKAAKHKKACPRLYLCCGESDILREDNRRFHAHLEGLGLPHIYEEWAGDHNWTFWDMAIQKALAFCTDR